MVASIDAFITKNLSLIEFVDAEIEALKLEILILEDEVGELEGKKIEMEKIMHEFELRHNIELGDLLFRILTIRKDQAKAQLERDAENERKRMLFEDAESDYREFESMYRKAKKQKIRPLNDEDFRELKSRFRKACHLCHPDKFLDAMKELAQKTFIELKDAYERNDLPRVTAILEALENGKLNVF